ncbi:hypothetical protein C0J52_01325 [Blattella germanica]|nr:hypothetical protein C0J52_01325 [Blattella germanica]
MIVTENGRPWKECSGERMEQLSLLLCPIEIDARTTHPLSHRTRGRSWQSYLEQRNGNECNSRYPALQNTKQFSLTFQTNKLS